MSLENQARKTVRDVADECARDPELRARVKMDPKAALAEEGVDLPFDEARAVEDTPETTHVVLTDPNAELSDEQLETVVGGVGFSPLDYYNRMQRMHRMMSRTGEFALPGE